MICKIIKISVEIEKLYWNSVWIFFSFTFEILISPSGGGVLQMKTHIVPQPWLSSLGNEWAQCTELSSNLISLEKGYDDMCVLRTES